MIVENLEHGLHIGFGGKFYTLWNVGRPNNYGSQNAKYEGKISIDLETAKSKYPNAKISLHLKGKSWELHEKITYPNDCFQFGRYAGQKLSDISDIEYMKWYSSNTRHTKELKNVMFELGFSIYEDQFLLQSEIKEVNELRKREYQKANCTVRVTLVSNINTDSFCIKFVREGGDIDDWQKYESLPISGDISNDRLETGYYNGYCWIYMPEFSRRRSMKKQEVILTIKDNYITKIEQV